MSRVWRTIKGYIFWTYDRGSFHYDVMVTLILIFIFLAPQFINFKDKPLPHQTGIYFTEEGNRLVYRVDASIVDAQDDALIRTNLLHVIQPISGRVSIDSMEALRDASGRIEAYRAVVRKEGPR